MVVAEVEERPEDGDDLDGGVDPVQDGVACGLRALQMARAKTRYLARNVIHIFFHVHYFITTCDVKIQCI